jgi:hypothetical protein
MVNFTRRRQRGSQTIEMGLVLVPLCAFLLLIMDMSWAIFVRSTLQHSVREGVRFAVTSRLLDGMQHDASVKTVVQRHALGLLNGADGSSLIDIRYFEPDTMTETASNRSGNIIEISVDGYALTPLGSLLRKATPLNMMARASDRMESQPGGIAPER